MDRLPEGAKLNALRRIDLPAGAVLHGLKASEAEYAGFGEAYFSCVLAGQVKAWKRHSRMVSNLIVPVGTVQLKLFDAREQTRTSGEWFDLNIGEDNYQRLTLPPGLWFGFKGLGTGLNLMLNIASIEHDPSESETAPLDDLRFSKSGW